MIHIKKILPEYYDAILCWDKTFELRLANWECNSWDILILEEIHPISRIPTGRSLQKEVTYVRRTKDIDFYTEEDIEKYGYQIIAFHP